MNLKMAQRTGLLQNWGADSFVRVFMRPAWRRTWLSMLLATALLAVLFSAAAQPTNGTDFSAFQVIAQRNIFDPNRVPHKHYNSTRAERVADSFSFLGTMSYEKGSFAFFDGTSPELRKVLELNGDIAGFKLTTLAPKSVTLSSGTNEVVLPVGTQMRRDYDGHWKISTEQASYSGTGASSASGLGSRRRPHASSAASTMAAGKSQVEDANATDSEPDTNAAEAAALSSGGANDALTRLMQQRAQEEQQLGAGQ
jgi:hypothetical protein